MTSGEMRGERRVVFLWSCFCVVNPPFKLLVRWPFKEKGGGERDKGTWREREREKGSKENCRAFAAMLQRVSWLLFLF